MQIQPFNAGLGATNSTYDAAASAAEHAKFSEELRKVQRQAEASSSSQTDIEAQKRREKLKEACEGFEAMFMNMMYREMRNTVPEGGLFKKSNAMNIFEDMRDTEMMKVAAKGGGIGLADMLYKQLSPQVESQIKALQQTSEK
ncbi:MAG: rod-binding protein [Selenomonadaceae bacterium]|nr:rod-binding protein [Selenomonadaceae bacterium]